ncbi:integrase core domain-containing protein [Bradyrhizobium guangxiense]
MAPSLRRATPPKSIPSRPCCSRLGIKHRYTKPYRPQTNGKVERFWRTLDDDVIDGATFDNLDHFANELFEYMIYYNNFRPHQALGGKTPKDFAAEKTETMRSAN